MVTDGGPRPDGTLAHPPAHSGAVLTAAFRRGVLELFVDCAPFEPEVADGTLGCQDSRFSVHDDVWLDQDATAARERRRWRLRRGRADVGGMASDERRERGSEVTRQAVRAHPWCRTGRAACSNGRAHGGATALATRMGILALLFGPYR